MTPYQDIEDKRVYNVGYRAGRRSAVVHFLGNRCMYEGCEVSGPKNLEIHHLNPIKKRGRDDTHWYYLHEMELYCKEHHGIVNRMMSKNGQ